MGRNALGEFEQLVLLAVMRVGSRAYGVPVLKEIRQRTGRRVARAAVYVALRRLEEKEFLRSHLAKPAPVRGGRSKRYFEVRESGLEELRGSRRALLNMWEGLERRLE